MYAVGVLTRESYATPANFRQFGQQSINQRRGHKDIQSTLDIADG